MNVEYYTQEWREEALCRQADPEAWFPEHNVSPTVTQAAIEICGRCPVRGECLAEALAKRHPQGIWGAKTADEREAILNGDAA